MGIQICSIKGAEWQNKEKFDKSSKIFSQTTGRYALIFALGQGDSSSFK